MRQPFYPAVLIAVLYAFTSLQGNAAPDRKLVPQGPPPARIIDVVDLQKADSASKLAATTLQGLVNRGKESRVFLLCFDTDAYPSLFWLNELKAKGCISGYNRISEAVYFEKYLAAAEGLVICDPDLPASINVASMIAAVENRVAVMPDQADRFREVSGDTTDLRGRWENNAAAYAWAFETLWPRMRHDILASYHPTQTAHHLRDYLVSQRIFTFWITGLGHDQAAFADHGVEKAVVERVLAAAPPDIPLIGWWSAGDTDPGMTEYDGVGWAGRFGKITLASDWQANLSLMSGVPVDMDAVLKRFKARKTAVRKSLAGEDKVYLSFVIMESGDAPTYWQHVQKRVWNDPARGSLPIGWSITPALLDALPSVGEWFLDNATPNDHFFMALSGWGYCHPYRGLMSRTKNPEAAWKSFLDTTAFQMERLGLDQIGLYTDAWKPFRRKEKDAITRRYTQNIPGLEGLIMGMGRDMEITETEAHYALENVIVSHVFTRWDPRNVGRSPASNEWLAEEIRRHTPSERPSFLFVHPLSWSYYPSDLKAVMEELGEDYAAVAPAELFSLIRASLAKN